MDDVNYSFQINKQIFLVFKAKFTGNSRDGQRGSDYGYGYPRTRDDRQAPRHRYNNDDDNRQSSGMDRPKYSGRYSDNQ